MMERSDSTEVRRGAIPAGRCRRPERPARRAAHHKHRDAQPERERVRPHALRPRVFTFIAALACRRKTVNTAAAQAVAVSNPPNHSHRSPPSWDRGTRTVESARDIQAQAEMQIKNVFQAGIVGTRGKPNGNGEKPPSDLIF